MDVRKQIRDFVVTNYLEGEDDKALRDDESLELTHIVDSARSVELIIFLEKEFGLVVQNDEATAENLDTVNGMVAYVECKLGIRDAS
jgi:acyl carrier protein